MKLAKTTLLLILCMLMLTPFTYASSIVNQKVYLKPTVIEFAHGFICIQTETDTIVVNNVYTDAQGLYIYKNEIQQYVKAGGDSLALHRCQYCGRPFMIRWAKNRHEKKCKHNPANQHSNSQQTLNSGSPNSITPSILVAPPEPIR